LLLRANVKCTNCLKIKPSNSLDEMLHIHRDT
jgi:hypothetical protein